MQCYAKAPYINLPSVPTWHKTEQIYLYATPEIIDDKSFLPPEKYIVYNMTNVLHHTPEGCRFDSLWSH
jgi:hypothetical protein